MNRILWLPLLAATLLAGLQQQLLLRRPPRLLEIRGLPPGSGAAALELRFSRPMAVDSLREGLQLQPSLRFQLQGDGQRLRLQLPAGQTIPGPLRLMLAGRDGRGQALRPETVVWAPRPALVASRPAGPVAQLQRWDGRRWQTLATTGGPVQTLLPLGDGRGLALVTAADPMALQVWRLSVAADGRVQHHRRLGNEPLLFAHLSTDQQGSLLIQAASQLMGEVEVTLWPAQGQPQSLDLKASGPIRLLPQGSRVVLPERDGLALRTLPPLPPRRSFLPGSRDLSSFCPEAGRALLVRHWPDYRRSIEWLEPGRPPRQLWIGEDAVVATACAGGGEGLWALLIRGVSQPRLDLLTLDRSGQTPRRLALEGLELEPGTGLFHDPTRQQLLLQVREQGGARGGSRAALVNLRQGAVELLPGEVRQLGWLPSRRLIRLQGRAP